MDHGSDEEFGEGESLAIGCKEQRQHLHCLAHHTVLAFSCLEVLLGYLQGDQRLGDEFILEGLVLAVEVLYFFEGGEDVLDDGDVLA